MENSIIHIPAWVESSIFYQIFPERFDNGDPSNDPANVETWGGKPKSGNYFGGDLQGIINRLSYLKDLGITALYLNPIFAANSNHKYNTRDYLTIDPSFGTNELFDRFIQQCHANNIRVVLDGVFNHVGTAFFAFQDVMKNGPNSKYVSWFNIFSFPVVTKPAPNYECWWDIGSLPKLMVENPEVKKYIFDVTEFWIKKGIDGWRLDVPNEIPHQFWKEWRRHVKELNDQCYICGEIWTDASPWLKGDEFDGVMNYQFRSACLDFFAADAITVHEFDSRLAATRNALDEKINLSLWNLLDSHDTERYLTMCKGNLQLMKLSIIFQMTYVGVPLIYYGDEIGMRGGKDPDCRKCMIWDKTKWNTGLFEFYKKLIAMRKNSLALQQGTFAPIVVSNGKKIYGYQRRYKNQTVIILLNRSGDDTAIDVDFPDTIVEIKDELSGKIYRREGRKTPIDVPPYFARIFIATVQE